MAEKWKSKVLWEIFWARCRHPRTCPQPWPSGHELRRIPFFPLTKSKFAAAQHHLRQ